MPGMMPNAQQAQEPMPKEGPGPEEVLSMAGGALQKLAEISPEFAEVFAHFEDVASGTKKLPQSSSLEAGAADVKPAL